MSEVNTKNIIQNNPVAANYLAAGHFTIDVYSGFLNPIMPFIAAKIGIGIAITTVLMSISYLLSSLMQPIFWISIRQI